MGSWVTGLLASIAGLITMLGGGSTLPAPVERPGTHVLSGRFVDATGAPVSGNYGGSEGWSSGVLRDGEFAAALEPGERLDVGITTGPGPDVSLSLGLRAAGLDEGDLDLGDLVVPSADPLDVRVAAPDGSMVPEAQVGAEVDLLATPSDLDLGGSVAVEHAAFTSHAQSGADGVAVLRVPSGAERPTVTISASRPNGHAWKMTVPDDAPVEDGVLAVRLSSSPLLSGSLGSTTGASLRGWTVQVGDSRSKSRSDGRFAVPMTAGGNQVVVAKYPKNPTYVKFHPWPAGPFFVLAGDRMRTGVDRDLGRVRVRVPETVTMEVVDAHGVPVTGAVIGDASTPVDLLDKRLDWAGADDELAPGIGITSATWSTGAATTGIDGRVRVSIPRTSGGRLLTLPVSTGFRTHRNVDGTTADAVRLSDGTYRVVLRDLELPPRAAAPTGVRIRPADGKVRITWDPPARGGPNTTYVVTSTLDGTTTDAWGSQAEIPAKNGVLQAWTVRRVTEIGAGAAASTSAVVPRPLSLSLRGPREGEPVTRTRVEYAVSASVPIQSINCDPGAGLILIRCEPDSLVVRSEPGPGNRGLTVWVYDFGGTEAKVTRTFVRP